MCQLFLGNFYQMLNDTNSKETLRVSLFLVSVGRQCIWYIYDVLVYNTVISCVVRFNILEDILLFYQPLPVLWIIISVLNSPFQFIWYLTIHAADELKTKTVTKHGAQNWNLCNVWIVMPLGSLFSLKKKFVLNIYN